MATQWGGPSMADRIKAKLNAEAAFKKKYGVSSDEYISNARQAAYGKTSKASGFTGRSASGIKHTTKPPMQKGMLGAIKDYHDAEEAGKKFAKEGKLAEAIAKFDQALELRTEFEEKHSKAPDSGHEGAKKMLRERRNSLIGHKNRLDQTDPGVVKAKLEVDNFMKQHTLSPAPV